MDRLTNKKLKTICDGYFVNFASKEESVKYRMLAESAPKYEEIYRKLSDYEDKEEQGLLIELPVPIGGTVYEIVDRLDHKKNGTYKDISVSTVNGVKGNKMNPVILVCEGYCGTEKHFTPSAFGIRVFDTRSDAEEALAKMGGK